ncbi:hypothetical protein LZZ90_04480 [Flavobacterium sp. SM15]|uniref:VOC family protein n=1 Tax=Flavobacterium sp. SM15 TaxID=2908005 RepID=UPI001EDA2B0D|nr:VOC family protein [Flavobacterium sp. SM15]MCG2610756.1 hypothetical protein [Flavobacterium sp. SM15]
MLKKAQFIGIAPQLIVPDVSKAVAFYTDKLGFSVIGLVLDPPVYGMVERDGIQIHFGKSDMKTLKTNRDFRKISTDFIIWVPEIETYFEEIKNNGVEILEPITLRPYGSREFIIKDCNGFLITFGD